MSIGPKGAITKIVKFTARLDGAVFNLAFGNLKDGGNIDDQARDDNKDRNKILATIVTILKVFFDKYPDKWVFFRGSTPERTRLYRMAITLNLEELSTEFDIVGALTEKSTFKDGTFQKGINYYGFFVLGKAVALGSSIKFCFMNETEAMKVEIEKQRIIEFAATMGINLTVVDEPSKVTKLPPKIEESNRMLDQMDLSFLKNR